MAYNDTNEALSGSEYTFTFDYLNEDEVKVSIDGGEPLESNAYTLNGKTVTLSPVPSGSNIRIYRQTNLDDTEVKFASGSAIRASDLNKLSDQLLHSAQETNHDSFSRFGGEAAEADISMGGHRITNLQGTFTGQNQDNDAIDSYDDGDAASIGFVKHFFFDNGAETILQGEDWPADSNTTIATTKAVDYRVRSELQTALNDQILGEDGITITDGAVTAGQVNPITLGLENGGIDIEKINPDDINAAIDTVYGVDTNNNPTATTDWANTDDQVATLAAIAKRHDGYVQNDAPGGTDYNPGTIWFSEDGSTENAQYQTVNEHGEHLNNYFAIWTGSAWKGIVGGGTWINQNTLIWVDAENGSDKNDGHRVITPMRTIQGAVNKALDGDMIFVQPGIYREYLPIDLGDRKNVSIIGLSMRSVFVHPNPSGRWVVDSGREQALVNKVMTAGRRGGLDTTESSEYEVMFQLGSGSFVANMTLSGMKAKGTRGDAATDSFAHNPDDATEWQGYQGWYFGFAPSDDGTLGSKVRFTKSPYIQNVTAFADSNIDNTNLAPHVTDADPQDKGFAGDITSSMTGGALIVDGSVPHQDSPLRSFLTDAFTIITLDGPGVLVRKEGYAQLVSTFGHFAHYHAKAESGGMINMSNCTTDFGRFGLVADGQSTDAIFEGTVTAEHNDAKIVHVVSTEEPSEAWAKRGSTIPVNHMVLKYGTAYYPIKSVSDNTNGGYNVELYEGINIPAGSAKVYFHLQSLITTGGHVFEFAGSGTDYRAHPDNGGRPNPDNQVITNDPGAVYISSTDHNGNFKVGTVFQVNSDAESTDVTGTLTVDGTMNATTVQIGGVTTKASSTFFDANDDIKATSLPDIAGLPTTAQAYPSSVTLDAKGRVTAISSGTEPVTAVNVTGPITGDSTSKTPTIGVKTFGATEVVDGNPVTILNGVVSADSNDSGMFLKGDGSWASPQQSAFRVQLDTNASNSNAVDLDLTDDATPPNVVDTVTFVPGQNITLARSNDELTINAQSATANVHVGSSSNLPASPSPGQLFWDVETGEAYIYYSEAIPDPDDPNYPDGQNIANIGTDAQWIQFAPQQRGAGNGTVTQLDSGTGLEFSLDGGTSYNTSNFIQSTGHIKLADTAVTPAQYGSSTAVPQFTVDQQGRITTAGDVNIGSLSTSAMPTGTFGPLRIDRTQSLAISKIFVPAGTSDGATPPAYLGPVSVVCDLTDADSLLAVGDRVTIASTSGTNQSFLNATHTITEVVAEATVGNVTTPAHFKFVIADGVSGLQSYDETTTANLGTCTWIDNGLIDVDRIPGIPGERLTSGTIDALRLPSNIDKTNISNTGTWATSEIPSLSGDGSQANTYLENVQSDLTPKLGGNLNVLSNKIISTLGRDIKLDPDASGSVVIAGHVDNAILTFTDNAQNETRVTGTYTLGLTDLSGNADGTGAAFSVTVGAGPTFPVTVTLVDGGNGFVQNETISLPSIRIGGGSDVVVTVSTVSTAETRGGKLKLNSSSSTEADIKSITLEAPALTRNIVFNLPDDVPAVSTKPLLTFTNFSYTNNGDTKNVDLGFVEETVYNATQWTDSYSAPSSGPAAGPGLVPQATANDTNKYLKGDGTWGAITIPTVQTFESGMIQWWPGRTAKIPDGWLICDGSVYKYATATYDGTGGVSKTYNSFTTTAGTAMNLKPLRDALSESSNEKDGCIYDDQRTRVNADWKGIGTIDANNPAPTFTGDSHFTADEYFANEYFAVPDLRGEFIRGWDDVRNVDESRALGSEQGHLLGTHSHSFSSTTLGLNSCNGQYCGQNQFEYVDSGTGTGLVGGSVTGTVSTHIGAETRPRNIAMIAIIKL